MKIFRIKILLYIKKVLLVLIFKVNINFIKFFNFLLLLLFLKVGPIECNIILYIKKYLVKIKNDLIIKL